MKHVHPIEIVDDKKNALTQKSDKCSRSEINKGRSNEIEELSLGKFTDEEPEIDDVFVKDEKEWEKQLETEFSMTNDSAVKNEPIETTENEDIQDEPAAKIRIEEKPEKSPNVVSANRQVREARRKTAASRVGTIYLAISSSSPNAKQTAVQKPIPVQKPMPAVAKLMPIAKPTPNESQPTIQKSFKASPRSCSIKRVETLNKPNAEPTISTTQRPFLRVASSKTAETEPQTNKMTRSSPNTSNPMLRQHPEAATEVKEETKSSPAEMGANLKSLPKPAESVAVKSKNAGGPVEGPKIVEMMIGGKKVKVKKIMMSKAQVLEMTRDGRIKRNGGTLILKKK